MVRISRPRQPIELLQAKGNKHLTKSEIEERQKMELKVDFRDVKIPDYLPQNLVDEFNDIAGKMLQIGIMTELDEDCLARYLLAKQQYLRYTNLLNKATSRGNITEIEKLMTIQDKAFKQCRASANDLGLTIASRCKLVMPKIEEPPKENKFMKFSGGV